ncbi:MAG: hypothetical protein AAFZ52_04515 [Bacteroidota bacterium]
MRTKTISKLLLLLSFGLLVTCSQPRTIALNWYLRLEATDTCPDYGLYAGNAQVLCPVDRVVSNGDSIFITSQGNCYYFKLDDYRDGIDLPTVACADSAKLIQTAPWFWPRVPKRDKVTFTAVPTSPTTNQ